VVARGVPVGWGEPVYDRLDADIAYAMMGINAVKGVEIGAGFASVAQKGSEHGDEMTPRASCPTTPAACWAASPPGRTWSSSMAIKPTSSIRLAALDRPRRRTRSWSPPIGRHDPCVGIRATPIAEAMLALVLIDHALRHRAQCGD
jgi:chorismate synthase